ncbi:MAG: S9 family peptidase [Hyphomicrobiales bacterium]|nr:S9 family peptidase [Hyphomicrobiales bacterium]MDE2116164.1 S9 family peptidase [Hyphomicrobiales bacterium]
MTQSNPRNYPPVPAKPNSRIVHGTRLDDEYAWLRADNWQEVLAKPQALPASIRAVLDAQNKFADDILADTQSMREILLKEMRARILEEDSEPPTPDGAFDYFERTRQGGQHELLCRRPRGGGPETILLDGDALAKGKSFFELGDAMHSPDHRLLAWSSDDKGSELYTLRVQDMTRAANLRDRIPRTDGSAVWTRDSSAFYYVAVDANHRPARIMRHRIGTAMRLDELIFEENNPALFAHVHLCHSGQYAVIRSHDHDSSECRVLDLSDHAASPRLIEARQPGVQYDVEHCGGHFYLRTNVDGAKDFKLVAAPIHAPERANWVDVVPHVAGRMILSCTCFANFRVHMERENGLPRIVVFDNTSSQSHAIEFNEEAYALSMESGFEFDTPMLRFTYSSMTTPRQTYDYDMASRSRVLVKQQTLPSGHNPARYVTRRIFATARDGALIPISLLMRADMPKGTKAPVLLYGYGAYGYAIPANFSANRLSLVDRGFVYAIAHIRGGTDKGFAWYEDGKLLKKPNSFHDFITCAQHLIATGYCDAGTLVAHGGSAGGMLMGAIANLAPQLFAGIIADVPFVDVLNTMLDAQLPLTPPEWQEWGNPIESAEAFAAIAAYSPYDNVTHQAYPAIFAKGGLTDPRVTYWEPAKWVARLQAHITGGGPVFLKTNMDSGHGGASGRFDHLNEVAQDYAFAISRVNLPQWATQPEK